MRNILKAFEDYKSELYGVGKRKQLSHKERQKKKQKEEIVKEISNKLWLQIR